MFKKTIENIIFVSSILLALVLVYKIWFSGPLFPENSISFASEIRNTIFKPIISLFTDESENTSENMKFLLKPERVVVNFSGDRRQFVGSTDGYNDGLALTEDIMNRFLSGDLTLKSKETVNLDGYCSALKGKSIFVDYGKPCDYRLFSVDICEKIFNTYAGDVSAVQSYIISIHDSILNDIYIYLADPQSNNIYRYTLESDKTDIEKQMKELLLNDGTADTLSYSYELNFHKQQEDAISKLILAPTVLLDLMPLSLPSIVEIEKMDLLHSTALEKHILSAFSINTKTMSKYTDFRNAKVFVENNATLTLHPDGNIDYQTVSGAKGLDISREEDKNSYDVYAAASQAVDFVTNLCGAFPTSYFDSLRMNLASVSDTEYGSAYIIHFDYYINGVPIMRQTDQGPAHAITLEIEGGHLKSYRQNLYIYDRSDSASQNLQAFITAADSLVDAMYVEPDPIMIQSINPCYLVEEQGDITPRWQVVANETEQLVK